MVCFQPRRNGSVLEKIENDDEKPARPSTINPGQSMEAILNDKSKFTSYTINYRALEMNCSFGQYHIISY